MRQIFDRSQVPGTVGVAGIGIHVTQNLVAKVMTTLDMRREGPSARTPTDDHERLNVVSTLAQPTEVVAQRDSDAGYQDEAHRSEAGHGAEPNCRPLADRRGDHQRNGTNRDGARDLDDFLRARTEAM